MKKIIFVLSSAMVFTSCMKDKMYKDGEIGHVVDPQKIVELVAPNSTASTSSFALDFVNQEVTITVLPARISSSVPAPADLTVTLDTTVTSAYLAANPGLTHFKFSGGSIVSPLTLTIPQGSFASQPIQLKVNPSLFNPSAQYVIGFRVSSVSDPSFQINANYKTHYVLLGAKNFFDGIYDLSFSNYHPTNNPGYIGTTAEVHMVTTGANKCKIYWPAIPGYYNPAVLNGSLTAFSLQEPEYTIDLATNNVTVQNAYPGATTFYSMSNTGVNKYDPVAKTINTKWGYNYSGGNFDPANTREWTQFFTYTGPR